MIIHIQKVVGSGTTIKATALPLFFNGETKQNIFFGAICIECQREQKSSSYM